MATLLSLDLLVVDCTEMRHETDIFGPKAPYHGSEKGTPLNNYLAQWSGKRAVVFLDEYGKQQMMYANQCSCCSKMGTRKIAATPSDLTALKLSGYWPRT